MSFFPSFNEFLKTSRMDEAVFKHSTHIEDLIFVQGRKGVDVALEGLKHVIDTIGKASNVTEIQRKMDGAPAIVFGYLNNKFFVGTKSLFNKIPKINYTEEDVNANHDGALGEVLKNALKYLPSVCPKSKIFQGDFVFSDKSRKTETIDGVKCYSFQPNTIKYAVDCDSDLGKSIGNAKFGIVVHTEYKAHGLEPQDIELDNFDVSETSFGKNKDVWLTDTNHKDVSRIVPFQGPEASDLNKLLNDTKVLSTTVKFNEFTKLNEFLMTFVNTYIRASKAFPNSNVMQEDFVNYLVQLKDKEVNSKKTAAAKDKVLAKYNPLIKDAQSAKTMPKLFDLHKALTNIKLLLINKLESIKSLKTFLTKSDGTLEVTGSEGYVLAQTNAKSCKLVDRYQFSKANFSSDYLKGWEH